MNSSAWTLEETNLRFSLFGFTNTSSFHRPAPFKSSDSSFKNRQRSEDYKAASASHHMAKLSPTRTGKRRAEQFSPSTARLLRSPFHRLFLLSHRHHQSEANACLVGKRHPRPQKERQKPTRRVAHRVAICVTSQALAMNPSHLNHQSPQSNTDIYCKSRRPAQQVIKWPSPMPVSKTRNRETDASKPSTARLQHAAVLSPSSPAKILGLWTRISPEIYGYRC